MKFGLSDAEEEKKFIVSHGMVPYKVKCDICGLVHYQGSGVYPLRKVSGYEVVCCNACYEGNCDGWNPCHEPKLLARLAEIGIDAPCRNKDGWLPREF